MSGERFLEVLNSTFMACDQKGTGFVEINRLIDFLISQEPSWLDNGTVKDEFNKVLNGNLNSVISKDDFIKSLLEWEPSRYQDKDYGKGENVFGEAAKRSNSTSGVSEPSELTSGSTFSIEDMYSGTNFVTGEQTFTNEDIVEEISHNDSGNSQADLRLVKVLQSEMATLLRKNEYLENVNTSLLGQVSSSEDMLAKQKEEAEDLKNQLIQTKKRVEMLVQEREEAEDRINLVIEENKSMKIQVSQSERENAKLTTIVSRLDKELESSLSKNVENNSKLEELKNKLIEITDIHNSTVSLIEKERESFTKKEKEKEIALNEVTIENQKLQQQLEANSSYTEDVKYKLKTALKELSGMQSERMGVAMEVLSDGDDDSKIHFDENFFLGGTIPFQASLMAELGDKVDSNKRECCCVCQQNLPLVSRPLDTADAVVGENIVETTEKATMTALYLQEKHDQCPNVETKDAEVKCSFKSPKELTVQNSTFHLLKSKRSVKKWASLLGIIAVLSFLLLIFSFYIFICQNVKDSFRSKKYLHFIFDLLHVRVKVSDTFVPIQ